MAQFKIQINMETGNIEVLSSKKIIDALNEAISILTANGFSVISAHSMLASYVPVKIQDYADKYQPSSYVDDSSHDTVYVGVYSTTKKEIRMAIKIALNEILDTVNDFNETDDSEDCQNCHQIVKPNQMP